MALRYYANAPATTLSASCTNVATSITVTSTAGLPISYPYTLILDRGLSTEEAVSVTSAAGNVLTVTRGIDSTTAFAHSISASVVHGITAQDIREPNSHINANTGVHGVAGSVVGTSDTQTLTNKTVNLASNTLTGTRAQFNTAMSDGDFASQAGAETLTNKTLALGSNTVSGTLAQFNTAVTDADLASLAGTETLTNKTVNLTSNTLTGTTAQFNTALSDGNFATLDGSETLTNKTLTSPTITGIGEKFFSVKTADETVTSSTVLQNDDHLSCAVTTGRTYAFRLVLFGNCGSNTPDLKMAFTSPAGTLHWGTLAPDVASGITAATSTYRTQTGSGNSLSVGAGVDALVVIHGVYVATGTGTLQFQWAQDVSNASGVTLKTGSYMIVERIA